MQELSLHSTQSLPRTILLVFLLLVSVLSEIPKVAIRPIKPIKPSGFSPIGQAFGSSPSLPGSEGYWRCACGYAAMSVRYALLSCPQREGERDEELGEMARDLKEVLGTRHGATAAIRLILRTGPLE
jgi:hypothetical protein